jgi:hypothetical protein
MLKHVLATAISSRQRIAIILRGPCLMNRIADVFVQSMQKTAKILNSLTLMRIIANAFVKRKPISANQNQKLHSLTKLHVPVYVM